MNRSSPRRVPARRALVSTTVAFVSFAMGAAADWTHYRGPGHDGTYPGVIRTNWTAQPPARLWLKSIEPALSSITIANGRAFTQARRSSGGQAREFAVALDAATGKELWAVNLDRAAYPNEGVGDDDGPRSTPVIDGDRVFVFSSYLRLYCLDAATGQQVWKRDFPAELGAAVIPWQNAASPVVLGDLVYVNANAGQSRLMALRKSDGTTAWRRHDAAMTQATPIVASPGGVPQVIFFTQPGLIAVDPLTGAQLWQFPFSYSTSTAASPVVADDIVYCSAAYTRGSGAVRVSKQGAGLAAPQLWKKVNANMNHWATPVHHEGHLYGVFGQSSTSLRCIEAATGNERWRVSSVGGESVGYGSVLKVDHRLLVLADGGMLVLVDPSPAGYREIDRFQTVEGKCWNNAALDDGTLYVRSTEQIAAYQFAPPAPPPPPPPALVLEPDLTVTGDQVRLAVRAADGTPVPTARADALALQATEDATNPGAGWTAVPATRKVVDGTVVLETPATPSIPRRFFRTREAR